MTEEFEPRSEIEEGHLDPPQRALARTLNEIFDTAMASYREAKGREINCAIGLVGEIGKDELSRLLEAMPVVADIDVNKDLGDRAGILFDISTATRLTNFIVSGRVEKEYSAGGRHISSLQGFATPIVKALSATCEEATGRDFGSLRSVIVIDKKEREQLLAGFPDTLLQVTTSLYAGGERAGRMVLLLPVHLLDILAESKEFSTHAAVSPYERMELEEVDDSIERLHLHREREPSMENIDLILDIQLKLNARLGQVEMPIGEIMKLAPGSVIDIDRLVDEPIELVVNDRPIARGEIVVVQENFGIKITEIISQKDRIRSLR